MKKLLTIFLLSMASLTILVGCQNSEEKESKDNNSVIIAGSTSVTPFAEKIAEAFEKENTGITVDVQGLGSTAGVKASNENTADIGMASRELKPEEENMGLTEHIIAYEGIGVIVNPKNKVKELDIENLKKIFSGEINNWKQVGGADKNIIVISREAGSGTRSAFDELVGLEEENGDTKVSTVTAEALIADGNGAIRQNVAGKENSISYISLGFFDESVRAVKIDGIEPTIESVKSGDYKISRPFLMLTKGEMKKVAKDYIDFVMSEKGQDIIEKEGGVRIDKK